MKSKIVIEDGDVKISFAPESDIERLAILDLGDDVSVSHSHQSLVLRRRRAELRKISDVVVSEIVAESS